MQQLAPSKGKTAPPSGITSTAENDGAVTDTQNQKKMKRVERFGMPLQLSEEEERNIRAEFFQPSEEEMKGKAAGGCLRSYYTLISENVDKKGIVLYVLGRILMGLIVAKKMILDHQDPPDPNAFWELFKVFLIVDVVTVFWKIVGMILRLRMRKTR